MHIYDTKNGKDFVICMKKDEFIRLVSEGVECLKETNPRAGLPYFRDDSGGGYFNFSIMDSVQYREAISEAIKCKPWPRVLHSAGMYRTSDFMGNQCWACKKCRGLGVCYCNSEEGEDICHCGWIKSECKCRIGKKSPEAT